MKMTIKAARVNKNLKLAEAAKLFGVTAASLWNYENHKSYPDVRIVQKMIEVYGIPYDQLVFLPDDN